MQVAVEGASDLGRNESGVEEQLEVGILRVGHCVLSEGRISRCEVRVEMGWGGGPKGWWSRVI